MRRFIGVIAIGQDAESGSDYHVSEPTAFQRCFRAAASWVEGGRGCFTTHTCSSHHTVLYLTEQRRN